MDPVYLCALSSMQLSWHRSYSCSCRNASSWCAPLCSVRPAELTCVWCRNAIDWLASLYRVPWGAANHCNVTFEAGACRCAFAACFVGVNSQKPVLSTQPSQIRQVLQAYLQLLAAVIALPIAAGESAWGSQSLQRHLQGKRSPLLSCCGLPRASASGAQAGECVCVCVCA